MTLIPEVQESFPTNTENPGDKEKQQQRQIQDDVINPGNESYVYEPLFLLGYAESPGILVYKDDKNEIIAKFRTLTPNEMRDVYEASTRFQTSVAQAITEKLETLARAITTINNTPLVLPQKEQQEYFEKYNQNPSPLTMARIILHQKIKALVVIDALYDKYLEFSEGVYKKFEDGKKN